MATENQIVEDEDYSLLTYLSHAAETDVGMKREENQDSYGVIEEEDFKIYSVADGMGGVKGGAIASQLAIATFKENISASGEITEANLSSAIKDANTKVFQRGKEDPEFTGMGTTYVALAFTHETLFVFHVGDSRAYRVRGERIEQLTHDHTLIQELVDSGALSEDQAEDHPVSHMLTRSLGPTEDVRPDCRELTDGPIAGDRFLLCSDGLYNLVTAGEMNELMRAYSDEDAAVKMIALANKRGGTDNITVLLLTISDEYPRTLEDLPDSIQQAIVYEDTLELDRNELKATTSSLQEEEVPESIDGSPSIESTVSLESTVSFEDQDIPEEDSDFDLPPPPPPSESMPSDSKRRIVTIVMGVAAAITVVFVALKGGFYDAAEQSPIKTVEAPAENVPIESAPLEVEEVVAIVDVDDPVIEGVLEASENEEIDNEFEFIEPGRNVEDVDKRREIVTTQIADLEEMLRRLSEPISGEFGDMLKENEQLTLEKRNKSREVRSRVDIATRKLSVWIGRKKRLDSTDALSMSLEVAAVSDTVEKAKTAFDGITWKYLKEAEILRYEPDNTERKKSLLVLQRERQVKLRELGKAVRTAIQSEIQKTDREIVSLSLERDALDREISELERKRKIALTIMKGTEEEKAVLKEGLELELSVARGELAELTFSNPDPIPNLTPHPSLEPDLLISP